MSLIAPAWLLLGAFGLLVLILHVRRRRTLEIPSIQIWRQLATGRAAALLRLCGPAGRVALDWRGLRRRGIAIPGRCGTDLAVTGEIVQRFPQKLGWSALRRASARRIAMRVGLLGV